MVKKGSCEISVPSAGTPKGGKQTSGAVRHKRVNSNGAGKGENLKSFPK